MKKIIFLLIIISTLFSCKEEYISVPKPRMYPKVVYPQGYSFTKFNRKDCPFEFDYPDYGRIKQSKAFYKEEVRNDCWFDIQYKSLNAVLYCSYSDIKDKKAYQVMVDKNYLLVNKHNRKADFINENIILKEQNPIGVQFEIEGEVATPYQFFLTDTLNHFFRASLYFNAAPNPDSIAPIYRFIRKDMDRMIGTFEWK